MKLISLFTALFALAANAYVYHVPAPNNLQAESEYMPTSATATVTNGMLSVHYCLPASLVGDKAPEFSFTGTVTTDFTEVSGSDVYGYCMFAKDKPLTCMLKYPGLDIDDTSRDQAIQKDFPTDVSNRIAVAKLFESEPAGILNVDVTQP